MVSCSANGGGRVADCSWQSNSFSKGLDDHYARTGSAGQGKKVKVSGSAAATGRARQQT